MDSIFPTDPNPTLPILPLRNSVLFPASVVPVNVGRPRSVRLIEEIMTSGGDRPLVGVVGQSRPDLEDPTESEIFHVGTVARVLKVIRLNSGNYSVVLQGVSRMKILDVTGRHPFLRARVERIKELPRSDVEIDALAAHLREAARSLSTLLPTASRESSSSLDNVTDAGALADIITSNLAIATSAKQEILEQLDVRLRLRKVLEIVTRQGEVHRVRKEISTMVEEEMSRSQREYLLRQQLRTIKAELGETDDDEDELEDLRQKVADCDLPHEVEKTARKQLGRMRTMNAASSEYHVTRSYVEWLVELPWTKLTPDRLNVAEARRVLDEDHHGLDKAKRRITEYIAVRKLRRDVRGPILCFVGPPGVGKTSLARSIARATERAFVRVSLGGVQDEAEIRGHRRTYVGSFPGRVITAMKTAGTRNPVMLLDEIDKLVREGRGDPSAALLEVLDPEQNGTFVDHYIEHSFDLSQVMFIATANDISTIPGPLLDRMEVIHVPGYTFEEKLAICQSFLVPRQLSDHGLTPDRLDFTEAGLSRIISEYTREAGVRKLEQRVASVCRHAAVRLAHGEDIELRIDHADVEPILGPPRYLAEETERTAQAGVVAGLAWTAAGGDVLYVEARQMPGRGRVHLTGQMGDVMKESAAAAFTYIRSHAEEHGLPPEFLSTIDVHVHLPQGGVPKDGPSAGVTVYVALASMLTRLRVRPDFAMTGEITLRGNITRVGGIKEKCLAAHRAGIRHVILPKQNECDLEEVPESVRKKLEFHLVSRISELLTLVVETDHEAAAQ